MKKIFLIFIILFSSSANSFGHIGHYNNFNKLEMEVLRNNEVIGYNFYFFKRNGKETIVTNQIQFEVKLLGATIFKVESYAEEKYLDDQLISFNSKTKQNNKEKFVNLSFDKENKEFEIKGSSYTGKGSLENVIGSWWNHKILQATSQISPVSGSIKEQVVTFIKKEKIEQYGKIYTTDHFKLRSKDMSIPKDKRLDFDIWYDSKTGKIIRVSYNRMGNWEYRLKNYE
ncbi:hypothetical protein OAM22_02615 [Candidatus Pelagibacter sp.]|nr:hypothetical protein [Candidatus Pelagibacter sp.]